MSFDFQKWYETVLKQMVAEAYLEKTALANSAQVRQALRQGNNRGDFILGLTRFTDVQFDDLFGTSETPIFQIRHQASDDPTSARNGPVCYSGTNILANTGLSATLIQKTGTNEFTLSIRSTEFQPWSLGGDRERDATGADIGGIAFQGFAFAQIDALEAYYEFLKTTVNPQTGQFYLPEGAVLDVTGYSLGGHLATVFTELHANEINHTYTFNGAGRGTWDQSRGDLSAMLDYYRAVLADPNYAGVPSPEDSVRSALYLAAAQATGPMDPLSIYNDPRYKWAAEETQREFSTVGLINPALGLADPNRTGLTNGADAKITQLYGKEFPGSAEGVANSGVHGPATGIFVEAQPFLEGWPSFLGGSADFGNGHAIILLSDSLALMRAYQKLDPNVSLESLNSIFSAVSNKRAITAFIGQSSSEEDAFENALDALRRLFLGDGVEPTKYVAGARGFGGLGARNDLYSNLDELVKSRLFAAAAGKLQIVDISTNTADEMQTAAQNDVAYRYALQQLNPFAVLDPQNSGIYDQFQGTLDFYNASSAPEGLTAKYIEDRAAFFERKFYITTRNLDRFYQDPVTSDVNAFPNAPDAQGRAYQLEGKDFQDRSSGFVASRDDNSDVLQHFIFGSTGADILKGGDLEDDLYGGGGDDVFVGGRGTDYLEGGEGFDIYSFAANDGQDTILDADGDGLIVRNGKHVVLGIEHDGQWSFNGTTYTRNGSDLEVEFAEPDDKITLKDFDFAEGQTVGYDGIRLVDTLGIATGEARIFVGDKQDYDADPNADGIQTEADAFGNTVRSDVAEQNREDTFLGGTGTEVEYFQTAGGNDTIYADGSGSVTSSSGGADWIELGAGRDFAYGGAGNDVIEGGADGSWTYADTNQQVVTEAGGDVLQGGAGDDALFAEARVDVDAAILASETDAPTGEKGDFLSGGAGNDWLIGAAGKDLLFGGGGNDIIVGGAGDDTIESDGGYETASLLWQVTRETTPVPGGRNGYVGDYSDNLTIADASEGGADVVYGGDGADWVFAASGDDFVDGGSGDDVLFGMDGADVLVGGEGNDDIYGDRGQEVTALWGDYLDGGAGNDTLWGDWGDDILVGGRDDDILVGGSGPGALVGLGKDTYIFNRGDGKDTIIDDSTGAEASALVFGDGFDRNSLHLKIGSMILDFGGGDSVRLAGFDPYNAGSAAAFDTLSFADGAVLTFQDVLAIGFDIDGTDENDDGHDADHPQLIGTAFKDNIRGFGGNDELAGYAGNDLLEGGAGNDRLFGMEGDDSLGGGDGSDAIVGGVGSDTLAGGDGGDLLWGEAGSDVLNGGSGRDTLIGGAGDDAYVFGAGDTAFDFEGASTIRFGEGISVADVSLRLQFVNTLPTYTIELPGAASDADRMYVQLSSEGQLAAFEFADGAVLDHQAIIRETSVASQSLTGTAGDDVLDGHAGTDLLLGSGGNDTLIGRRGNDDLRGGTGDDILDGGAGNDSLEGGDGSDLYIVRRSEGADTIREADAAGDDILRLTDLASTDVTLARRANGDLVLTLAGGGTVTIEGQYDGASSGIETIELSDSTAITRAELDALTVAPITGTAGDDVLTGTAFADTLQGGAGDDTLDGRGGDDVLDGGAGTDTYVLGGLPGYGTIVESAAEANAIRLAAGLEFDDVRYRREGNDLVLSVRGVDGGLVLHDYYTGATNWTVSSNTEAGIGVSALLDLVDGITPPDTTSEIKATYLDDAELQYAIYLQSFGANGGVLVSVQAPSDAAVITRNAPFGETGSFSTFHLNVADITGGPSANTLDFRSSGVVIADAGAGDDLIDNRGGGFRNTSPSVSIGSYLYGNNGNDRIIGTFDADVLVGGIGDDYLAGDDGNDTYVVFATDPGIDVVDEVITNVDLGGGHLAAASGRGSTDTLKLIDVNFADATFSVGQYDSNAVNVNGTGSIYKTLDIDWGAGQGVRVLLPDENNRALNSFPGQSYGVETVDFADGTTLSLSQILSEINPEKTGTPGDQATVNGSEQADNLRSVFANTSPLTWLRSTVNGFGGNDTLAGGDQNDAFYGGEGDDSISDDGLASDDLLVGGPGDDTLSGSWGNDLYIFNRGYGHDVVSDGAGYLNLEENRDTLRFGADIAPTDIGVGQDNYNIYLVVLGSSDRITLSGALGAQESNAGVDLVEFNDGTVWSRDDLLARMGVLPGSEFDDVIGGTLGDDLIAGGGGEDQLFGLAGNDILRGGEGIDDLEEWDVDWNFIGGGNNLIDGGAADDYVYHEGHSFVIGGAGDDWIDLFGDDSVIAFNAGDGADTVYVAGSMTLSLGGIAASDLVLSEEGTDLVLAGGADSVRLSRQLEADPRDWPTARLQILGDDVRTYDLNAVITDFYSAQGGNPAFQMALGAVLPQHQVSTSTTEAWGGDVAYAYAHGELAAVTDEDIQRVLADTGFGTQAQFVERAPGAPIDGGDHGGVLLGTSAPEEIAGGAGNDWLDGSAGNDTLAGGTGDDLLSGGSGSDTYVYNAGDGVDAIVDPGAGGDGNTVLFGAGITSSDITLGLGSLMLRVGDTGGTLHLTSFDPENPFGVRDVDTYRFADGTVLSYEELLARGFDLTGTSGVDLITGTATVDRITGGQGDDVLAGGFGSDTYSFNIGDGADTVQEGTDGGATDVLRFGSGINSQSLALARSGDGIVITLPTAGDQVTLAGWFTLPGGTVERIEFADSTFWTAAELESHISTGNQAPVLNTPIADQAATEDSSFTFAVPATTFSDPDAGDTLAYTATRSDGSALPSWLSFDTQTRTLSGMPLNDDVGNLSLRLTATDTSNAGVYDDFEISVANTNDAPIVSIPLEDQSVDAGQNFGYSIPPGTFTDIDAGDALSYSATLADGSVLPSWLAFNATTQTFSGRVPHNLTGSFDIEVAADDGHGNSEEPSSASDVFTLVVGRGGGGGGGGNGNEGVGNGEDAPPPGHDHNLNDGPGTSPGNPGAPRHANDHQPDRNVIQRAGIAPEGGAPSDPIDSAPLWLGPKAFEFEALLDFLARESASDAANGAAEIARRWKLVANYVESDAGMGDVTDAAALGLQPRGYALSATNGSAPKDFIGVSATGLPSLETFRGLREGMATL